MKKFITFLLLTFILSTTIFLGCNNKLNDELIKLPNKIFVYYDITPIEVSKDNKAFKELVELTNKRIDEEKISTIQDVVTEQYVDSLKKENLAIEFLYEEEHEMNLKDSTLTPIKYNKLFFPLILNDESNYNESSIENCFQYGTSTNGYTDSSRGPLNNSEELIKLIMDNIITE